MVTTSISKAIVLMAADYIYAAHLCCVTLLFFFAL